MKGEKLREIRSALGLSAQAMAKFVQVYDGSRIRKWERGEAEVPGPVAVLLTAIVESEAVRQHFGLALDGDRPSLSAD